MVSLGFACGGRDVGKRHCKCFLLSSPVLPRPCCRGKLMKLSLLSILLGLGMAVPQVYGLLKPAGLAAAARKFPRHLPTGIFLMLLGTAWFVWFVKIEPIADFESLKPYMMV